MKVSLIGKNFISSLTLPKSVLGNYWLSGKMDGEIRKLVNIEGISNKWVIKSGDYLKIMDHKTISFNKGNNRLNLSDPSKIKLIAMEELEPYKIYTICIGRSSEVFALCCVPLEDEIYKKFEIKSSKQIVIGKNRESDIYYHNDFVDDIHACISIKNKKYILENKDRTFGTFVNEEPVFDSPIELANGDVIFIMGLKIIILGNYLYINNPDKKVICDGSTLKEVRSIDKLLDKPIQDDDDNLELYTEKDYFSNFPRIRNVIEKEKVNIDTPPAKQNINQMPAILQLGPSIAMGVMMLLNMYNTIQSRINGTASKRSIMISIIVTILMLISMLVFPIISKKYDKHRKKKYEEKRLKKYKEYILTKVDQIDEIMEKQSKILKESFPSPEECMNIILSKDARLWERKIEDFDFLSIRLGTGSIPTDIDIHYPEERFTMDEDILMDTVHLVGRKSKILEEVPITFPLAEKTISALISNDEDAVDRFMQSMLLQIITFHNYQDLKMVFLLKKESMKKLDYIKMTPHIWNESKELRFWADNIADMDAISNYLEQVFQARQDSKGDYRAFSPFYLIITDDYKEIENLKVVSEILSDERNRGFGIFCITNNIMQLPKECRTFIQLEKNTGKIFESELTTKNQKDFNTDPFKPIYFEKICQTIANIPIKYTAVENMMLPDNYFFLEMYDVGRIEQLNISNRWRNNDSTLSLRAPIGIDPTGRQISLDIHEKYHGPHGLIAGSTGSGKSEFIITYILSLAVNYSPEDVTFILIDYKGGGLAGAFEKPNFKLPHLVGTITNIEKMGLQRSLASVQSELRRREVIFNKAREIIDEGTIDIYKYQRMYHDGIVKEPIPHLLIICDEFAELRQQEPEFMSELISVSRVGRSLGVHLILATQKPAGVVNDQIRSNSKFAVCLKVQEASDSNDVLKRPDAAFLKNPGEFFLKVGNNEYFNLGQSALASTPYYPQDIVRNKVDTNIEFISNIGTQIKRVDDGASITRLVHEGEQLTNIVKFMYDTAKREHLKVRKLWLDSIPEDIFIDEIREKYNAENVDNDIRPVIGEYDDPYNQRQDIVRLELSSGRNTIIYGNAESGKESLLGTIVYDIITNYSSDNVDMYLMDFGSEALKVFNGAPHIGDITFLDDYEKTDRLFKMLYNVIDERKNILSEYGGDYKLYLRTSGEKMPLIVVVINNYEVFAESFTNRYDDSMLIITREGPKYGIVFVVTATGVNCMRYRLAHNFTEKIALQMNNEDEYLSIFDRVGRKRPSRLFGRGLICRGEQKGIYEFQSARVAMPEDYNLVVRDKVRELIDLDKNVTQKIPVMPDLVTVALIRGKNRGLKQVPIGIVRKDLRVCTYNFKRRFMNIITSKVRETVIEFVNNVIKELELDSSINLVVFDIERIQDETKINEIFLDLVNQASEKKLKETLIIILGIDKFLINIDAKEFLKNLKVLEATKECSLVVADVLAKIKGHEFEDWFKNYHTGDSGIWLGNGVEGQYLMSISANRREVINNCGNSYGCVITQGTPLMVKMLGMREMGDDDE